MKKDINFIIWGAFEYRIGRQTPINFTRELSKNHKVLYIEHPFTFLKYLLYRERKQFFDYLKHRLKNFKFIFRVNNNIWIKRIFKIPFFPISYPSFIRKINLRINGYFINRFIKNKFVNNTVFIAFTPLPFELLNVIQSKANIYYCIDAYSDTEYLKNSKGIKKEIIKLEEKILRNADISIFTSNYLYEKKSKLSKQSYVLENAVDDLHFQSKVVPLENLKNLSKPVIGYCGGLSPIANLTLLENIAREIEGASLVIIGGGKLPELLLKQKNIYHFGLEPYYKIPSYINTFNICLIPYSLNERTKSAFPIKLYEYLAQGKPVVTTSNPSLTNSKTVDQNLLYYADTPDEFVLQVKKALKEDSEELRKRRIESAKKNTWKSRTDTLLKIISEHFED